MSDPFMVQLADLARAQSTANKWILVPSNSLGWMLGERLVQEGCDWVNLRFTTPFQLALDGAAPDLLAEGINPCPETLGPCLIQSLLLRHPDHRFAPLILQPGMAEALWNTLGECRMAGVQLDELDAMYQSYLDANGLADRSMVFRRGARTKVREGDFVLLYPYQVWSPLVREFVRGLPGQHILPKATELALPRRLVGSREPVPTKRAGTAQFYYAGRRDVEFLEILRRVECPYDQVEIVAHAEDLPLLADILVESRCPATFSDGLPIGLSRPGQALLGLLAWLEGGLTGFHVRELLLANLLVAPPNSWTAARLIQAARIGWGRAEYGLKLTALAQRSVSQPTPAPWLQLQADQALQLADWFSELFRKLPDAHDGRVDLPRWLGGLQRLLVEELDHATEATDSLVAVLEELKILPGSHWPLPQVLALLRERLRSLAWNASRPRPGHVHVTSLDSPGLSGRPLIFVTGEEEGRCVHVAAEDCVLSDERRRTLHSGLALSTDRVEEQLFCVTERLATVQGTVTYSYSARDRQGEQEQLPSWLFFQAARAVHPELQSYPLLLDWLGEPVQPWLAEEQEMRRGETADVLQIYPDLARGVEAERQRESTAFTVYDGWVPSAADLWDPRSQQKGVSVSRLQSLANCPFQFFLSNGLGIYPEPLALPDPDCWLDAATRGHVLHEVFAQYGRLRRKGESPDRATLWELLDESLKQQLSAPSPLLESLERDSLRRDLGHFLQLEATRPGRTPVGVEIPFGLGEELGEALAQSGPVALDLGEGMAFRLQGRIDRLDRVAGGYSVVDYKTGKYFGLAGEGLYDRGRHLQHGLYALAAQQLLGEKVLESGYYFTHAQASQVWVSFAFPEIALLRGVLELVMQPLRSGAFVPTHQSKDDCRFCDYRQACSAHQDRRIQAKLQDSLLQPRKQLLEQR